MPSLFYKVLQLKKDMESAADLSLRKGNRELAINWKEASQKLVPVLGIIKVIQRNKDKKDLHYKFVRDKI